MSKIDEYIIASFKDVRKCDNDLPVDVHERTFVFRFAHYLADYIESDDYYEQYKVDVEYNRYLGNPKELNDRKIFPDLIVHKRGMLDNLVAIEFKKNNDSLTDKVRLIKVTKDKNYLYKNAFFIRINKNKIEKYCDGYWKDILGDNHE